MTQLRRFDEAADYALRALESARQDADPIGEHSSLTVLGHAQSGVERFEEALDCYEQSRGILVKLGDQWGLTIVLNYLGEIYHELGRLDDGFACHQHAVVTFREFHHVGRESWTLRLLGDVRLSAGRGADAIGCHRQALDLARTYGLRVLEAEALESPGTDARRLGEPQAASQQWSEAMALYEQVGDPRGGDLRARLREA